MKTLEDVVSDIKFKEKELSALRKKNEKAETKKGERTLERELRIVRDAKLYLEHKPTAASIHRQHAEVTKKLTIVERDFDVFWSMCNKVLYQDKADARTKYYRDNDMAKLNSEIRFLNYLMS